MKTIQEIKEMLSRSEGQQALEDYLTEHESDDTWYSFHEFIEDRDD